MAEMMVASGILVLLITSVILCNLWGLSMNVREQIWLNASDDAGKALGLIYRDIRSSVSNSVGTMAGGSFTAVNSTNTQSGNALMIYPSTNTSSWICYYFNSTSNLVRTNYTGTSSGDFSYVSANTLMTNNNIFTFKDALGNTYSSPQATPVIQIDLQFSKLQNPEISIAPGNAVDFYEIVTTIASRNRP
jgi:hypothetical protein